MKRATDTGQIHSLFARWSRMETKRREQQDDLKDLFSEAKAFGFNTKSLRAAFAEKYREENEDAETRQKRATDDADLDLYLAALARVREAEAEGADPATGEFPDEHEQPETAAPVHSPAAIPADANEGGDDADGASESGAPILSSQGHGQREGEAASADLPTNSESAEPAGAPAGKSVEAPASAAPSNVTPLRSASGLERMPGCQHPSACAGMWNKRCFSCEKAWAADHGDEAVQA